jgi:hypothetical protein
MERTEQSVRVKNGRLENALVRVRGEVKGQPAAPAQPAVIDQHQCTYLPRVQGAVAGQPMVIKNSDGTLHNVRGYAGAKSVFNVAQPPMAKAMERPLPADVEVIRLKCDIHSWMTAWVVVNPNPYFATTNAEGSFDIEDVPVGTYTLEAWHEVLGTKTAQVTVKEGQQATVSFEFSRQRPQARGCGGGAEVERSAGQVPSAQAEGVVPAILLRAALVRARGEVQQDDTPGRVHIGGVQEGLVECGCTRAPPRCCLRASASARGGRCRRPA